MRIVTVLRSALSINAVMILLARLGVDLGTDVLDYPALGVFFRFQVSDFDRFLVSFLCAILFFLAIYFGLFGRCVVSVTPKGN